MGLQVGRESCEKDRHRNHVAHLNCPDRSLSALAVSDSRIVGREPVELLQGLLDGRVWPSAKLIAHVAQSALGHARRDCADSLKQHELLANAGLNATISTTETEVSDCILERFHLRIEVRVLTRERPQIAYEAREHAGQCRAQRAGATQVIAEAELVYEPG